MRLASSPSLAVLVVFSALTLGGCASTAINATENATASSGMDISLFAEGAFTREPEIVDCKTAEGTATTCYKLVTSGAPAGREPGPFCPGTITDGADDGGVWFSKDGTGDLVDSTGEFILRLSDYYGDEKWVLYDAKTNEIRYTATKEACLGAA